jgi:hypothetical protein
METMRRAAGPTKTLTVEVLRGSGVISERVVIARFGSWPAALAAAGLKPSRSVHLWIEADLAANLQQLYDLYGRAPPPPR